MEMIFILGFFIMLGVVWAFFATGWKRKVAVVVLPICALTFAYALFVLLPTYIDHRNAARSAPVIGSWNATRGGAVFEKWKFTPNGEILGGDNADKEVGNFEIDMNDPTRIYIRWLGFSYGVPYRIVVKSAEVELVPLGPERATINLKK